MDLEFGLCARPLVDENCEANDNATIEACSYRSLASAYQFLPNMLSGARLSLRRSGSMCAEASFAHVRCSEEHVFVTNDGKR
jgi:hypothetical protein